MAENAGRYSGQSYFSYCNVQNIVITLHRRKTKWIFDILEQKVVNFVFFQRGNDSVVGRDGNSLASLM